MLTINVLNSSLMFHVTVAILHIYIICNYFLEETHDFISHGVCYGFPSDL